MNTKVIHLSCIKGKFSLRNYKNLTRDMVMFFLVFSLLQGTKHYSK